MTKFFDMNLLTGNSGNTSETIFESIYPQFEKHGITMLLERELHFHWFKKCS